jgi:hypothetical protein
MAVNVLIQSGIGAVTNPHPTGKILFNSRGVLYALYQKTDNVLYIAYSSNNGVAWTEVTSGVTVTSQHDYASFCIDSTDVIHVFYRKNSDGIGYYKAITNNTWGSEETVTSTDTIFYPAIIVDSNDVPHCAWRTDTTASALRYNNRVGGAWSALTTLRTGLATNPCVVIDSNDYIYVTYIINNDVEYVRYTGSWSGGAVVILSASISQHSTVIDSSDQVHTVARSTNQLDYSKFSSGSWSAAVTLTLTSSQPQRCFLSINASDQLDLFYDINTAATIYYLQNVSGTWGSDSAIITAAASHTITFPVVRTPYYPIISGVKTQLPTTGYYFAFIDTFGGINSLRYYTTDNLALQVPVTKNYSRGDLAALPTNDSGLETLFTTAGYSNVASDDDVYETQTATAKYSIFEFKDQADDSTDEIHVTWKGKTNIAPSSSDVILEIYNRTDSLWQQLDKDTTTGANTEFTLSGDITDSLAEYYSGSNFVSCRVYQLADT